MTDQDSLKSAVEDLPDKNSSPPATRRRPRLAIKLLVLGASCAVALALGEIAVRLAVAIFHRAPLVVSDAYAGWALQPDLRNQLRVGDGGQYIISTDGEGHRLTRGIDEPLPPSSPAIIIVGDSFAQGQAVNDSETFAWLLAHSPPRNVVNLGVLGYGTDQELAGLAAFLQLHPAFKVRDIVVLVFDNDFIDVQTNYHPALGRSKPRYRITNGRLEMGNYQRSVSDRLMDSSYLYWLLNSKRALLFKDPEPEISAGAELVVACVAAMQRLAAERGARISVLAHRHLRNPRPIPASVWNDFLHRTGALDITPRLLSMTGQDPISYDGGHWSAAGHKEAAAIIRELLDAPAAVTRAQNPGPEAR